MMFEIINSSNWLNYKHKTCFEMGGLVERAMLLLDCTKISCAVGGICMTSWRDRSSTSRLPVDWKSLVIE